MYYTNELDLNDILLLKTLLNSNIRYWKTFVKTILNVHKFISYSLLFLLTDNYIPHFKYRIIMNNWIKKINYE